MATFIGCVGASISKRKPGEILAVFASSFGASKFSCPVTTAGRESSSAISHAGRSGRCDRSGYSHPLLGVGSQVGAAANLREQVPDVVVTG